MRVTSLGLLVLVGCSSPSFDLGNIDGAPPDDTALGDTALGDTALGDTAPGDTAKADTTADTGPGDTASTDSSGDSTALDSGTDTATDTGKPDGATDTSPDTLVDSTVDSSLDSSVDSAADSGSFETGPLDSSLDGGPADVGPPDVVAEVPADAGCAPLPTTATDVYVDQRAVKLGSGAVSCPLDNIQAALALAWTGSGVRTIHVAGAATLLSYKEVGPVIVKAGFVLKGDGPSRTQIVSSGKCGTGTFDCAVWIEPGGKVDGFAITQAVGGTNMNGVFMAPSSGASGTPPTLQNSDVSGLDSNGLIIQGPAIVGPSVRVTKNKSNGLSAYSLSGGTVKVLNDLTNPNVFDGNSFSGVSVGGALTLNFDGGSASSNGSTGVSLFGTGTHRIAGLSANFNGNTGLQVGAGNTLTLRSSVFFTNSGVGVRYQHGSGTDTLDFGTLADLGGNQFGSTSSANLNKRAGIVICNSDPPSTQPAEGNKWSSCLPVQTSIVTCDIPTTQPYADVLFQLRTGVTATSALTVGTLNCSSGP